MKIPLSELIRIGTTAFEWVQALSEAIRGRDTQRVEALLPEELRTVVTLRMGKALADDIALRNRREQEMGA